jgi:hypothetical protein
VGTVAGDGVKTGLVAAGGVGFRIPVVVTPGLPKGVKVIGAADAANMRLAAAGIGAGRSAGGALLGGETTIFGNAMEGAGVVMVARACAGAEAPQSWVAVRAWKTTLEGSWT